MRRAVSILILVLFALSSKAQDGAAIDELFQKYQGREGITSVYISSKMFSMFSGQNSGNAEVDDLMNKLKSIRILTVEDSLINLKVNFYDELRKKTDFSSYEELMVVNEADNVTKFLIRQQGKTISELLIISAGKGGNTLISIRGDLDLKNISSLSGKMGIKQLEELDKMEQKPPKN
ncbi:MAG: DUF4252 domain-containing protein [Bacteroidales bacterium]